MADELNITIAFSYSKNGVEIYKRVNFTPDVAGDSFVHHIQEVGTSEEALTEPTDIGTPAWCYVRNTDSSNFITLGATGSLNLKLLAGESCVFRLNAALYAQADTAAVDVEYAIIEL